MIGLVFDVDDTLYEQIVPFENAFRSLFDIDIDMEKFYLSNPRSGKRFRCIPNR